VGKRLWLITTLLLMISFLMVGCARHPEGLKNPKELTDIEKNRVIEIALHTPEATEWLKKESKYRTTLAWVSIVWWRGEASEIRYLPFEKPETDPNYQLVPQEAAWYPGVVIHFGEPSQFVIQVAVDLAKGKAVDVMSSPDLSSPERFPTPPPKTGN